MKNEFEKGREYERISHDLFFHKFLGWACLVMAPIWYFFSVWNFNTRINGWAVLTIFGCLALLLGYSESKKLTKTT